MASPAHCFYCFETLAAHFERRDPPSLERVLNLYEQYNKTPTSTDASGDGGEDRDNERDVDKADLEDLGSEDEDMDDEDSEVEPTTNASNTASRRSRHPQLPSISRLQAYTPSSSSTSTSSTPSLLSASSSNSQLTAATSASTLSSNSSSTSQGPSYSSRLSLTSTYPLFVTWNTISRSRPPQKSLRGCIGTFDSLPLSTGLSTYALTSALDDTRFSPIPSSLLPSLSCSLTLLADFETCAHALDWTLGTHGLRVSFVVRGRKYGATYLPDVAVEQGWDRAECVESLMRKAGWEGSSGSNYSGGGGVRRMLRGASRSSTSMTASEEGEVKKQPWEEVSDFRAVRYTGLKASAGYAEWKEWRAWAEAKGGL